MMTRPHIFHIAEPRHWHAAQQTGSYTQSTRGATLAEVGFIHCSYLEQVIPTAHRFYSDAPTPLLLLNIDPHLVPAEIRVEQLGPAPAAFPHIYGPLPIDAVTATHQLTRNADGWQLPPQILRTL